MTKSLDKIKNEKLLEFIRSCLKPESERPNEDELLNGEFLNDLTSEDNNYPVLEDNNLELIKQSSKNVTPCSIYKRVFDQENQPIKNKYRINEKRSEEKIISPFEITYKNKSENLVKSAQKPKYTKDIDIVGLRTTNKNLTQIDPIPKMNINTNNNNNNNLYKSKISETIAKLSYGNVTHHSSSEDFGNISSENNLPIFKHNNIKPDFPIQNHDLKTKKLKNLAEAKIEVKISEEKNEDENVINITLMKKEKSKKKKRKILNFF